MKGLIFSVKRYAIHDGPGIRVTFFLKGCPLSCWWCHNPEGISPDPETVEQIDKVGEREFKKMEEAGKYYTVNEILEILDKEQIFISESKGGVTFSGGEPMMQTDFLLETLKACKNNDYHTAVDTSGHSLFENYAKIIPYTDLFLFDIKHMDDTRHIELSGMSNVPLQTLAANPPARDPGRATDFHHLQVRLEIRHGQRQLSDGRLWMDGKLRR